MKEKQQGKNSTKIAKAERIVEKFRPVYLQVHKKIHLYTHAHICIHIYMHIHMYILVKR